MKEYRASLTRILNVLLENMIGLFASLLNFFPSVPWNKSSSERFLAIVYVSPSAGVNK
jgi:hypothetical protein